MSDQAIQDERRAVLCGPMAEATLRAERERHARLAAARRERDRRLVAAIRKEMA
jgi:hypothetical protein